MLLAHAIKRRLCRFEMTPNFPVGELAAWAECAGYSPNLMLEAVIQARQELDVGLQALQRAGSASSATLIQHEYWCFYADQVVAYYRDLLRCREEGR